MSRVVTRKLVARLLCTYCLVPEIPEAIAMLVVDLLVSRGVFTDKKGHLDAAGKEGVTSLPPTQAGRELHRAVWNARSDRVIAIVVLPLVEFFNPDEDDDPGTISMERLPQMTAHNNRRLISELVQNKEYALAQIDDSVRGIAEPIVAWMENCSGPDVRRTFPEHTAPKAAAAVDAALDAARTIDRPADQQRPDENLGALSAREWASRVGVEYDALRKRLERARGATDIGWIQTTDKRESGPTFLYSQAMVDPIVAELKASMRSSTERPSAQDLSF